MGKEAENGYVPVLFAETQEAAEIYRRLLEDHEIKVIVGYDELEEDIGYVPENIEGEEGIPVFVTADSLDEASEIISDFDDQDEFEELDDDISADGEEEEEEFGMGPASEDEPKTEEEDESDEDEEDEFSVGLFDEEDEEDFEFGDDDLEEFDEFDEDDDDDFEKI